MIKEGWAVIHQNDVDDDNWEFHLIGVFPSETLAKTFISNQERSTPDLEKITGEANQTFWFGNDHYWLVELW